MVEGVPGGMVEEVSAWWRECLVAWYRLDDGMLGSDTATENASQQCKHPVSPLLFPFSCFSFLLGPPLIQEDRMWDMSNCSNMASTCG